MSNATIRLPSEIVDALITRLRAESAAALAPPDVDWRTDRYAFERRERAAAKGRERAALLRTLADALACRSGDVEFSVNEDALDLAAVHELRR